MADIVVPDAGCRHLLDVLLRIPNFTAEIWRLRAYVNDYSPGRSTITSNFVEASFPGYLPIAVNRGLWQPSVTLDDTAYSLYATTPQRFATTLGEYIVYGYFVTDTTTGITLWCQRFNLPVVVNPSAPLDFQPQMRMLSLFAPP